MQMIQDGEFTSAAEKPLRMTGTAESCRVSRLYVADDCEEGGGGTLVMFGCKGVVDGYFSCWCVYIVTDVLDFF